MGILLARSRSELKSMLASLAVTLEDAGVRSSIGFVPTMGALHAGHASLVKRSSKENSITVVSVFVNPKQFGASEDLGKYPRTLEADLELCERAGAQIVFAPSVQEMYPAGFRTQVSVSSLDQVLCGAYRPGHFDGVCTVVLLLLNLVGANHAYFGLKDFQQFTILSRMMLDLEHPTNIVGVATVRDPDGLAMSSRNKFLDTSARQVALQIPKALKASVDLYLQGERARDRLLEFCKAQLQDNVAFELQYCELLDAQKLSAPADIIDSECVLAIAAFVTGADGVRTRLIDNVVLSRNPERLEELFDFFHQPSKPS